MAGSRPSRLRSERTSGSRVVEPLALEARGARCRARGRDADLLGEREERQHERHDDGAQDESEAVRLATGADRAADAPAIECRSAGDPRRAARAGVRGSAIVRGRAPS